MLRLLFTTKDLSKQMTVITDGVDSQMNVFVTENTVGDVDYYKSLGIVIKADITYNIGTGNLDKKAADEIMELLLAVNRRGNTVLLVTHEQRYADLCGRKIEISDGKI